MRKAKGKKQQHTWTGKPGWYEQQQQERAALRALKDQIWQVFDHTALKRICEMHESEFAEYLDERPTMLERRHVGSDFYYYQDNGSQILAVAHLDTVVDHEERTANFVNTEAGPVVFSGALDDRLGAYIILDLLPALGIQFDVLLTVGEESGQSTAEDFYAEKDYHWMIEFDRGGTDVVMYQYEDDEIVQLVRDTGAKVADGIFSDISYLEHLGIKGFNWGVGYQDYHGPRSHAFLEDTVEMVAYFLRFHVANKDVPLPHKPAPVFGRSGRAGWWGEPEPWVVDEDRRGEICDTCGDEIGTWCDGRCETEVAEVVDEVIDNPTSDDFVRYEAAMDAALARSKG